MGTSEPHDLQRKKQVMDGWMDVSSFKYSKLQTSSICINMYVLIVLTCFNLLCFLLSIYSTHEKEIFNLSEVFSLFNKN